MIDTVLNLALLIALLLTVAAFAFGYRTGVHARSARAATTIVLAFCGIVTLALVGGTIPLAVKYGPLVTREFLLLAGAFDLAALGGLIVATTSWGRFAAPVVLVLVGADLTGFVLLNRQVAALVQQFVGTGGGGKYEPEKNKDCPANLKSLYQGFVAYAELYDALPPGDGWLDKDEIKSRLQRDEWMHCPAVSNRHDDKFGYAYNDALAGRKLGGKPLAQQPNAGTTPLAYDSSNLVKSAHDAFASLPKPGRHGGRNNILYLDGHVEAVAPK